MQTRLLVMLLAGCATAPASTEDPFDDGFRPTGTVNLYDRTITFDATSVRAPRVQLGSRADGSWAGRLNDQQVFVTVTPDAVRGPDFTMVRQSPAPGVLVITGQAGPRTYRFELGPEEATLSTRGYGLTLRGRDVDDQLVRYGTEGGTVRPGMLELHGAAAEYPWPQLGFALLATMP